MFLHQSLALRNGRHLNFKLDKKKKKRKKKKSLRVYTFLHRSLALKTGGHLNLKDGQGLERTISTADSPYLNKNKGCKRID